MMTLSVTATWMMWNLNECFNRCTLIQPKSLEGNNVNNQFILVIILVKMLIIICMCGVIFVEIQELNEEENRDRG
jgi:hypothetical protein